MLEIFNNLAPFFEDCYRRINVREYAKIIGISPPTASKLLKQYTKETLLQEEKERNYLFYHANMESKVFIDLSRVYWQYILEEFITYLEKELTNPTIILFGSLAKAEVTKNSDIDIALFAHKKDINIKQFEKKLGRNIQIFWFPSFEAVKPQELRANIVNGYVLKGRL
jgi:predicted nucleotidyltransferase